MDKKQGLQEKIDALRQKMKKLEADVEEGIALTLAAKERFGSKRANSESK